MTQIQHNLVMKVVHPDMDEIGQANGYDIIAKTFRGSSVNSSLILGDIIKEDILKDIKAYLYDQIELPFLILQYFVKGTDPFYISYDGHRYDLYRRCIFTVGDKKLKFKPNGDIYVVKTKEIVSNTDNNDRLIELLDEIGYEIEWNLNLSDIGKLKQYAIYFSPSKVIGLSDGFSKSDALVRFMSNFLVTKDRNKYLDTLNMVTNIIGPKDIPKMRTDEGPDEEEGEGYYIQEDVKENIDHILLLIEKKWKHCIYIKIKQINRLPVMLLEFW